MEKRTLLVLAEMPSDGSVGGLSLHRLAVRGDKLGGHHAKRAVALGNNVGLDVTVVVLAGPDKAAVALDRLGYHVV